MTIIRRFGGSGSGSSGAAGASADARAFALAGSTAEDPSDILASAVQDGDDVVVTLDATTISNAPNTAASWTQPLRNLLGAVSTVDLGDIARAFVRANDLVPVTDLWVGIAFESADARGVAYRIAAVAGDWQVQHATRATAGGAWSAWTAGTSNAATQAADGWLIAGTGGTQARMAALGRDSTGAHITAAGVATAAGQVNVGGSYDRVRLCVGWIAGALGTVPVTVRVRAGTIPLKFTDLPTVKRLFGLAP